MIKDTLLKLIFTPLLGIVISLTSGIISFSKYSLPEIIGSFCYFIIVSYCIWMGCFVIHAHLRRSFTVKQNPFSKIAIICTCSCTYGTAVSGLLALLWIIFSREQFRLDPVRNFMIFSILAIIVFTLVYEVLYLCKERLGDNNVVVQLDHDLSKAERMALRNELDPHFIFNSLSSLSHLIAHDQKKAHLFNDRLGQVYKYFLLNKDKELVPINEEIDFIGSYFFMLQIRYDNKLKLTLDLNTNARGWMVVPCALQILVENAIKHNQFSYENPLEISIRIADDYLTVLNNLNSKVYQANSTKIGLRNLSAQYKLSSKRSLIVESSAASFIVKLPLIKPPLTC